MVVDVPFGAQLRRLRERAGLTQEELAAAAGLSAQAISALERGQRSAPYPQTVRALAQALGLSADEQAALLLARASRRDAVAGANDAAVPALAQPLLRTRLLSPPLRPNLVRRPRLLGQIAGLSPGVVALLSAPAGWGKTTLVTTWIASLPAEAARRVAWLSLDTADTDPADLLRYLVAALQRVDQALGQASSACLDSPPVAPEIALTLLINDLAALTVPVALVLDDYHCLRTGAAQRLMALLIEHLPPLLTILITTREDPPLPLSRLRASGQLYEIRADALRFSADEAAALMTDSMGLVIAPEGIAALTRRTEGWAAGLQFAALALRGHPDPATFINDFLGSHRFVLDYLAEEVLDTLPGHLHTFLLQTAILDRLSGSLCDAVMGLEGVEADHATPPSPQAYSQLILRELARANLFVAPMDDRNVWYRYHQLFSEVLRARLHAGASPAQVRALHGRAARWYAAQKLWDEALMHGLAAQQWDTAALALTQRDDDMLARGATDQLRAYLDQLPEAVYADYPRLWMFHGLCAVDAWDMERAVMYFARAAAAFAAAGNLTSQGEALLHLADCKRVSGELAAAQELLGQALALPLSPRARLVALISRIWEAMALGDPTAARTALDNALTVMTQSVSGRMRYELVRAIHSPLLVLPGGAAWAERLLGLAEHWSVPAVSPMQTLLLGIDGLVRLFHGDLAGADMTLGRAVDLAAPSGATTLLAIDVGLMYAALPMFRGDMATANSRFSALLMLYRQPELAGHMRAWGAYHRCYLAWLRWHEGRLDEVRALAQELEDRAGNHEWPVALYVRHIVGWLCAATVDRNAAEQHLCAAEAELLRFPDAVMLGDVRVLRVWSALRQNQADTALALLITVLDDYAKRGVPGLLLLHGPAIARPLLRMVLTHDAHGATARQLLAAIGEAVPAAPPTPPTPAASVDDLTARERDVLAQIAAGAANGEIADQLVISPATVKKHINNLFAKLGARSRTQALARARERGLL